MGAFSASNLKARGKEPTSIWWILWLQFIFLITGVGQTVLVNLISYHGGANESTLLPVLCSYLSSACVYFLPDNQSESSTKRPPKTSVADSTTQSPITLQRPFRVSTSDLEMGGNHPPTSAASTSIMPVDTPTTPMKPIGPSPSSPKIDHSFYIFFVACWDLIATIVNFFALVWAGSGIYQVVYSSILIVTATFRHFLLNKRLSLKQWMACVVVTVGLLLSGLGHKHTRHPNADAMEAMEKIQQGEVVAAVIAGSASTAPYPGDTSSIFSTFIVPFIATVLFALEYVMIEKLLSLENAPSAQEVCTKLGLIGTAVSSGYVLFYVVPRWKQIVVASIHAVNGRWDVVLLAYLGTFVCNFGHNLTYFALLHVSGSVSTGINQALRAVFVFVISAICFCHYQETQCFNSYKLLSLVVVIGGVLRYAYVTYLRELSKGPDLDKNM